MAEVRTLTKQEMKITKAVGQITENTIGY